MALKGPQGSTQTQKNEVIACNSAEKSHTESRKTSTEDPKDEEPLVLSVAGSALHSRLRVHQRRGDGAVIVEPDGQP